MQEFSVHIHDDDDESKFQKAKEGKMQNRKNNVDKRNPKTQKDEEILNIQKKWPLDRERCTTITKQTKTSLFLTGNVKIIWDLE